MEPLPHVTRGVTPRPTGEPLGPRAEAYPPYVSFDPKTLETKTLASQARRPGSGALGQLASVDIQAREEIPYAPMIFREHQHPIRLPIVLSRDVVSRLLKL
jgi:hypothetical protein